MTHSLDPRFVGKTYGDFLFRPQRGVVTSRAAISLRSRLSAGIELGLPVVSSNMDSVTESGMAKAMALEGGLGFIHRALPIDRQVEMVRLVKRSHSAIIENPRSVPRDHTLGEARARSGDSTRSRRSWWRSARARACSRAS